MMWRNGFISLKALVAMLIGSMAAPGMTFAFFQQDLTPSPEIVSPGQPQPRSGFPGKRPDYQPGELILKFRDEAIVGAVAGELLQNRQAFQEITGDVHIDGLNARYKVKAMRRVFGKDAMAATATGPIDRQTAAIRHRQQHDRFKAEISSIREKRLK